MRSVSSSKTVADFLQVHRSSGVLLHVSSLPTAYGIGDLGPVAHLWIDLLARAGQQVWQILPLTPPSTGNSPYSSLSSLAGSCNLISIEQLVVDGYLALDEGFAEHRGSGPVQFSKVIEQKRKAVGLSWESFSRKSSRHQRAYGEFCKTESDWLDDYALFMALREAHPGKAWMDWPKPVQSRHPATLRSAAHDLAPRLDYYRFEQFIFYEQLDQLREHARRRGVKLLGDVPIFVSADSADVWASPHLFKLDRQQRPTVVAGVPPDYFSSTGQLWGNPLYNWKAMQSDGFSWWINRFRKQLRSVDLLRIDHFRGFAACWEVPAGSATAQRGRWARTPGAALFSAVELALGELPFIAEDLGTITPDVRELRDKFALPGMRVLQFAFGGGPDNEHLPHNYVRSAVAYTGTHDNDTTRGWYASLGKKERATLQKYMAASPRDISWDLLRLAWSSVANCAIAPMQDLLSLGSNSRMNIPNRAAGNWGWRMSSDQMDGDWPERLSELTQTYGRRAGEPNKVS